MKKTIILSTLIICLGLKGVAQEAGESFDPHGNAYATIFYNFHYSLSEESETAFEITRAYLGYEHQISPEFSGNVKLDIGSPGDLSEYSKIRRYAYFKNAYLRYKKNKLTLNFGLIDVSQFKTQEKYWGHRYVYKSLQDEHKFGASADIGAQMVYDLNNKLGFDFTLMNGEGYKALQSDNTYKAGLGMSYFVLDKLLLRLYYDVEIKDIWQSTYVAFIGYKMKETLVAGLECNIKENSGFANDYDQYTWSLYTSYDLNSKWQLFGRYDIVRSNVINEGENPWNLADDGSAIISGIQFMPHKRVKFALNYQDWVSYAKNLDTERYVFINCEFDLK